MTENAEQINEVYATLAGQINEFAVQRIFQNFTVALNNRVTRVHLLIQSSGGTVSDGVAAYNFIRKLPIEVIAYNGGGVFSIAVILFLAAQKRKASKTASFMIHRTTFTSPIPASSLQLQAVTDALALDDSRTEQILRGHLNLPDEKWSIHKNADLFLSADDALKYQLIDEIADFAPPLGATVFNVVG